MFLSFFQSINLGILHFFNSLYINPLLQSIAVLLQFLIKILAPLTCIFLIIFRKNKIKNLKLFSVLIILFIIQFTLFHQDFICINTVPMDGSIRSAHAMNSLQAIELHDFYPSFPSGSTSIIVSLGALFSKYYKKFIPVVIISLIIECFTKLYLGLHTPIDLIAGMICGYCIYLIIYYIFDKKLHYLE